LDAATLAAAIAEVGSLAIVGDFSKLQAQDDAAAVLGVLRGCRHPVGDALGMRERGTELRAVRDRRREQGCSKP